MIDEPEVKTMKHINKEWHKTELGWLHLITCNGKTYLNGVEIEIVMQ